MSQNIVNDTPIRQGVCPASLVENVTILVQLPGGFAGQSISFLTTRVEKSLNVCAKVKVCALNEEGS